jgi:sugar (pentulose or hexulose) kinase
VSSLPKLLWLRRHVPETRRAVRFLSVPEWAVHALGGDQVSELSLVSRTGLFDVPGRAPWLEALAMLDAGPSFLGELVAAGQPAGRVGGSAPAELRGAVLTVAGTTTRQRRSPSARRSTVRCSTRSGPRRHSCAQSGRLLTRGPSTGWRS